MMYTSKTTVFLGAITCLTLGAATASAQHEGMMQDKGAARSETADKPVNAMCPVGKEAIDPATPTVTYKGKTIGFCCDGCSEKFLSWADADKDQFVALAMAGKEPGNTSGVAAKPVASRRVGDPYMLTTCPVSGEQLGGEMGDAIVKVYDGREVRFCCKMCISDFEEDQAAGFEKIDQQIIASQLPYYPLTTCVVSGESLTGDPDMEPVNMVYNNRLVRLCCNGCKEDFMADPKAYLSKIDEAVIAQQSDAYPLKTCPVSGEPLEEGEVVEVVAGNRLFKFCCKKCKRDFKKNPTAVMAALDKAWAEQGGVPQ